MHPRRYTPGRHATGDEHLPPEALAYKLQDPQWCLKQAELVGEHCHRLIRRLFSNRVLDNLRAAQGVIRLGKKYGTGRLEEACERALHFDNPRYRAVKTILEKGLDQVPFKEEPKPALASVYQASGRFIRKRSELQVH